MRSQRPAHFYRYWSPIAWKTGFRSPSTALENRMDNPLPLVRLEQGMERQYLTWNFKKYKQLVIKLDEIVNKQKEKYQENMREKSYVIK